MDSQAPSEPERQDSLKCPNDPSFAQQEILAPLIPRWSNWALRPRTEVGQLPVCGWHHQNNRNSAIRSLMEWAIRRQAARRGERGRAALPHETPASARQLQSLVRPERAH